MIGFDEYFDYEEGSPFRPSSQPYEGSAFVAANTFKTSFIMDEQGFSKRKKPENNIKHLSIRVFIDEKEKKASLLELFRKELEQSITTYPYPLKHVHPDYLAFSTEGALDFRLIERSIDPEQKTPDLERLTYEFLAAEAIDRIRCSQYSFLGLPKEHYFVYHAGKEDELLLIQKANDVKTKTILLKMNHSELDLACQLAEKVNHRQFA